MARPGISKLGLPPRIYLPDICTPRVNGKPSFETPDESDREDLKRAQLLRESAFEHPEHVDPQAAVKLARRLEEGAGVGEIANTPASSVWMREQRRRIVGWLWFLSDDQPNLPVAIAHILPTSWIIPAADLMLADPKKLLERLRKDLNLCGAKDADGFLAAGLHGEFDPEHETFHLHVHADVLGGMIEVVREYREIERKRLSVTLEDGMKRPPVRIHRHLDHLPDPISYCFQSHWTMKKYHDLTTGEWERGKRRRIPEPWHSIFLLWMEKWKLEDLTLMMKLSVRQGKLYVKP